MQIDGMLSGVRVLDSTTNVAMPTAMHILADMGAEVIKIEGHTREESSNRDGPFQFLQHGKLGVTINLRGDGGLDLFKDLAKVSDVLVENNRAGTFQRLGLGYEELIKVNPTLIMLSNTGFGQTGPWKRYTGIGSFLELTTGVSNQTGYMDQGPRQVGGAWIDIHAAWMTVFSILAALNFRAETGKGQHIDLGMYQVGVTTLGVELLDFFSNGRNGTRMANRHPYHAPHGVYPCIGDDKWIAIAVESSEQWDSLKGIMGDPEWANNSEFSSRSGRHQNQDKLDGNLKAWTINYDAYELMHLLQNSGIPASIVPNSAEIMVDPHMKARGFYEKMEHSPESGFGARMFVGRPWKASKTPSYFRRPTPYLGEHNDAIFGELLGLSKKELGDLESANVIAEVPPKPKEKKGKTAAGGLQNLNNPGPSLENGTLAYIDADYQKRLGVEE